jgi:hypothetical protein
MADELVQLNEQTATAAMTPEDYNSELMDQLMGNPDMLDKLNQAVPEEDPAQAAPLAPEDPSHKTQLGFWESMKAAGNPFTTPSGVPEGTVARDAPVGDTTVAMAKGALKAGTSALDLATSAATTVSRYSGLYQIGRDDEEEKQFLQWYDSPAADRTPANYDGIQISGLGKKVDEFMGPTKGGINQFVEGGTQFAVAMLGAGRMLKVGLGGGLAATAEGAGVTAAVTKGVSMIPKVGVGISKSLGTVLKGAIADGVFFDPWEKKLSDMVENGPEFLSNPVTRYLVADKDDSEAEARFKRSLEGVMTGAAIDGFFKVLGVMKARFMFKSGSVSKDVAEEMMQKAGDALESGVNGADDAVRVIETGDGRFAVEGTDFKTTNILEPVPARKQGATVYQGFGPEHPSAENAGTQVIKPEEVLKEQQVAEVLGPPPKAPVPEAAAPVPSPSAQAGRVVFSNRAEAESFAATVNYAQKNAKLPRGKPTPEAVESFQKAMQKAEESGKIPNARDMAEEMENYGYNARYIQQPNDILNTVKAMVDADAAASRHTRRNWTHQEIVAAAEDMFPQTTGEDALAMAERVFGATERLPQEMLALRAVVWSHSRALRKLSQMVESSPSNKLAMDQMAAGLDTLMELHGLVTGASGNTARALGAHGIPLGSTIDKMGDNLVQPLAQEEAKAAVKGETTNAGKVAGSAVEDLRNKPAEAPASPVAASSGEQGTQAGVVPQSVANGQAEATSVVNQADILAQQEAAAAKPADVVAGNKAAPGEGTAAARPSARENATPEMMKAVEGPASDVSKPMSDSLKEWMDKHPGELIPMGENGFTTKAALSQEMKQYERLIADLKSRPRTPDVQEQIKAASAKVGEVSGLLQKVNKQLPKIPPYLAPMGRRATEGLTADQIRALARNVFRADGDPAAILWALRAGQVQKIANKTVDRSMARKFLDWAMNFRVEGMLSAPTTHMTNVMSNLQVMLSRPLEYWWAGTHFGSTSFKDAIKGNWSSNPALREEGADMLTGIFAGWNDSWKMAKKSFMDGANILDPGHTANDGGRALAAWQDSSWLNRVVHAPSRLLMASDEMFKQLNYRTSMRAQILRECREAGITDTEEIAKRLVDDIHMSFGPDGGVNPRALNYAQTNTFTNSLEYGWGKWLQENQSPFRKIIMPFVRTPTNIFRYVWQRTPILNMVQKGMVEDLKAGGERAALARSKSAMGVAMWGTGAALVSAGLVTGRGPTDPKLNKQMRDLGWQPYSIKIGDRYVSYKKADPVATSLGMIADLVQISGELKEKDQQFHIAGFIAAMVANLTNKSYMQGMVDFMDAATSNDENKLTQMFTGLATSFVPNILTKMDPRINLGDNNNGQGVFEDQGWVFNDSGQSPLREARGLVDSVMNRVPGFSSTLEPHRNIMGELVMRPPGYLNNAINPFTVSGKVDDSTVMGELIRIGKGMPMPSTTMFNGMIDLKDRSAFNDNGDGTNHNDQSPYDRMLEIMSNPPNGAPSLKQALSQLVHSKEWEDIPGDDAYGKGGMKYQMVTDMVAQYQEYAQAAVLSEYPLLQKAYFQAMEVDAVGKARGKAGVADTMQKWKDMWGGNKSPVQPKINWTETAPIRAAPPVGDFPSE